MIHKLYVNIAGWSKLDIDHDKKVILDTMKFDNRKMKHEYYMIVDEDDREPPILPLQCTILRSQEEVDNYLQAYEERKRLDNIPITELKRYMIEKRLK